MAVRVLPRALVPDVDTGEQDREHADRRDRGWARQDFWPPASSTKHLARVTSRLVGDLVRELVEELVELDGHPIVRPVDEARRSATRRPSSSATCQVARAAV